MTPPVVDLDRLRRETLGYGYRFRTPFGERLMVYADYTASGRSVRFLEHYLMGLEESYANTHTEDDVTGRSTTLMLHRAEAEIKRLAGGDDSTCVVAAGTGATGAIHRLQEILGVCLAPATRERIFGAIEEFGRERGDDTAERFRAYFDSRRPVVFVGPYEHHSNEVSWRESLAEVVEVDLCPQGGLDLEDLERRVSDPRWGDRPRIGSFSAASNVTGVRTDTHAVARILHRHGALACFDYAASAPYVPIDMNPAGDPEARLDAVFFSPHKFLGGPGSSGVLLFHRSLYREDLPPTFAAGGTVDYVGFSGQDYIADIEEREKPGTPGTLQIVKTMLAMQLKEAIGQRAIEEREHAFLERVMRRLEAHPNVEILGNTDPGRRIGIVSFNLRDDEGRYLHPKFATRLLNDLFGIQSRAGCSCAGPYGHRLLRIGEELSDRYRDRIAAGCQGIKPGWVRICLHYSMDDVDVDYLADAVLFLAEHGERFLPLYRFDLESGAWEHLHEVAEPGRDVGLAEALVAEPLVEIPVVDREREYAACLAEAKRLAEGIPAAAGDASLPGIDPELTYFRVVHLGEPV